MLLWSAECPKGDWPTTKLGEPAFQLGLGRIVGQTRHMEDLGPLRQKSPYIGASIHGTGEYVWMVVLGLRLADEAAKHTGQSNGFIHSATRRRGSQSLEVEWQVVLDGSA